MRGRGQVNSSFELLIQLTFFCWSKIERFLKFWEWERKFAYIERRRKKLLVQIKSDEVNDIASLLRKKTIVKKLMISNEPINLSPDSRDPSRKLVHQSPASLGKAISNFYLSSAALVRGNIYLIYYLCWRYVILFSCLNQNSFHFYFDVWEALSIRRNRLSLYRQIYLQRNGVFMKLRYCRGS